MNRDFELNQNKLVQAWQSQLPQTLDSSDQAQVFADEANPQALRIHIDTAGRSNYSFDFQCSYVDTREVKVDLVDVEREGRTVDERTDVIQNMAQDYTRQIHECAQALHDLTHHS
ncbi:MULTISPECIES: hypothetical protein [Paenibacillus]|jgi:hypothetical protein|uniref:hypothetical protein n=1 Tax=Paenibacillus TaxID=44249 RepID=UPI000CF85D3C|nr:MULTISPECIES: hypothetical protein [Paenibacillus]MBJ9993563.1 hypothetical protein [Paenibacillus sp. S28]MEC0179661.1 hypothetical protein [Paenibacillus favisporus]PQP87248.1 hypothetical protein CPT76_25650 [Paenibacillus sp. AR247]